VVGGVDNTQPFGVNPISLALVQKLGNQVACNSCSHRDLGFTGKIAGKWYSVWADTLWAAPGVTNPEKDTPGFHGMVRSSISLLTDDPLKVVDLNLNNDWPVPHQQPFIPYNEAWGESSRMAFGGASLCETDPESATGAIYILVVCALTATPRLLY